MNNNKRHFFCFLFIYFIFIFWVHRPFKSLTLQTAAAAVQTPDAQIFIFGSLLQLTTFFFFFLLVRNLIEFGTRFIITTKSDSLP